MNDAGGFGGDVLPNPEIRAAGTVPWRAGPSGPEVLLVHRPKYDDWSLPKGKRDPGEDLLLTAVRETQEETSVRPVLGPPLGAVSYLVRGVPKRVDYWSAVTADEAKPSHEIDDVAWLPLGQAAERLSYPHDREVLSRLVLRETVPLIILRHADAVPKGTTEDLLRPLNPSGRRDAAALAGLLACFAPHARALSSPALRCTQTVAPYAALTGTAVEETTDLARTTGGITAVPLIRALLEARRPAIVCLHRENLPVAVSAACSALGADPPADPVPPKGGFWVMHAAADGTAGTHGFLRGTVGELVALELHELGGTLTGATYGTPRTLPVAS